MQITAIEVSGFKNIKNVKIEFLRDINALIGFNNYGKTNFVKGVLYGIQFIKSTVKQRREMIASETARPLLEALQNNPYELVISFIDENQDMWEYHLGWHWQVNDKQMPRIICEKLLCNHTALLDRTASTAGSNTVDRSSQVKALELVVDSVDNCSPLFQIVSWIKSIDICGANLLGEITSRSIIIEPHKFDLATAIGLMQQEDPNSFHLLQDAYLALFPEIEQFNVVKENSLWQLKYKEIYIKQMMPFEYLSTGSRRLLALLFIAIKAEEYGIQVLVFEEVETCLHPRLIPLLLMALDNIARGCRIILTSHSPYLVQHLPLDSIYIATPTEAGVSSFRRIKTSLQHKLLEQAQKLDISLGVYLFDLLIESQYEPAILMEWLEK